MIGADNQQETSKNFYYSGFSVGELSCSILRLHNRKSKNGGIYYTPDLTISNADKKLLYNIDKVCGDNLGVITKIKGGFNLSFRGKKKVKSLLSFFDSYPPIAGDLTQSKIEIIRNTINVIEDE
ncbi:MAG: LAGLIDADG family homing endonuclease, partial [Patescibacteria group bacterium]